MITTNKCLPTLSNNIPSFNKYIFLLNLGRFDTKTGVWTELATGPMEGRGGTPVVATPSGLIYVVGGFAGREMADIHVYSVDTDTWTTCEQVEE